MDRDALFAKIKEYGLNTKEAYMAEAFSRNIGLLTQEEQERLANATVAIPGMGGVGGVHLITMVRTGVGRFHISDFDTYEPPNINRQIGARVPDFGRSKLEVMKEYALGINPYLEIKEFPEGINRENLDEFLEGVQVVLDGLDFFSFDTRRLLFTRAQEKGVYVITAGPMGFSSALLIFSPHEGMRFDEYFNIVEGMAPQDKYLSFGLGLAPRPTHIKYMDLSKVDFDSKAGPSLNIACQICSGIAGTEAVRIILNKKGVKPVPHYFQFDPYLRKYRKGRLRMGNRNPIQRLKMRIVKAILKMNKGQYKRSAPVLPEIKGMTEQIPEEVVRYISKAGIDAPSGDNVQPWTLSLQGNRVHLYLHRESDHSFFNVNQIASIISCGAVVENMRIAATSLGLDTRTEYLPSGENGDQMATLEFFKNDLPVDPLATALWKRHVNRKFYEQKPVSPSLLETIQQEISGFPGARIHFLTDERSLKKLGWLIYNADRIRTERRDLHEHLMRMIRFSHEEVLEKKDGFPLKNLEAGLGGEIFLKVSRPWWVMNLVNRTRLGRLVAFHSYQGIARSSGVGLLTIDGTGMKDFLDGGRAMERAWIRINQKGLAFQPMTAITLFWLRWQLRGEQEFSETHKKMLRGVWEEYRSLFPDVDFSREGQVMLFRFGYAKDIGFWTYRKDLATFLE